MPLELVTTPERRPHKQMYRLPDVWEKSIDSWLRWLKLSGIMPNSLKLRRGHVRWAAHHGAFDHPADVTLSDLVELTGNQEWSNDHRKGMRTSLVSFFEWAQAQEIVHHNPAAGLPRVKESKPNPRPAPDSVWFDLLAKATPRERLMGLLAGEAGMRRAEVAQAHYDDLLEDVNGYSLIVHGKGGKQRVVPITDHLAKAINEHCRDGYLFPGVDKWGNRIGDHVSEHHVGALVSKLMPPGWSMHKLRHRFATRGHNGTGNLRAVQEALGHVSVATTPEVRSSLTGVHQGRVECCIQGQARAIVSDITWGYGSTVSHLCLIL